MFEAPRKRPRNAPETRRQLVEATTRLMLRQGFAATSVEQICAESALSKGSFFHHFPSKEAIGVEAMAAFSRMGMELYAAASQGADADPLDELRRLLDVMIGLARQHGNELTCMVGMLSQELAASNESVREACVGHMDAWVALVAPMLRRAKRVHRPVAEFDADQVAWLLYSIWQGSMLIAKARKRPATVIQSLELSKSYLESLFVKRGLERARRSPSSALEKTPTGRAKRTRSSLRK